MQNKPLYSVSKLKNSYRYNVVDISWKIAHNTNDLASHRPILIMHFSVERDSWDSSLKLKFDPMICIDWGGVVRNVLPMRYYEKLLTEISLNSFNKHLSYFLGEPSNGARGKNELNLSPVPISIYRIKYIYRCILEFSMFKVLFTSRS